jgi:hypothetical protein
LNRNTEHHERKDILAFSRGCFLCAFVNANTGCLKVKTINVNKAHTYFFFEKVIVKM